MKKNFPVTGREREFQDDQNIVSLTDAKGIITAVNQDFIEIAGFSEEELIGKNHNIVRHPDMPPAAFQNLWDTIKAGDPWMGVVKNRCKDGNHYWVNAYVSPVYEGGQIVGYQSVRTKPKREWVKRAEKLYATINAGKGGFRLPTFSMQHKFFLTSLLMLVIMAAVAVLSGANMSLIGGAALLGAVLSWTLASFSTRGLRRAAAEAKQIFHNDVGLMVYGSRQDEVGQIEMAMVALQARQTTLLTRMNEAVDALRSVSESSSRNAETTAEDVTEQNQSIQEVALALGEMVTAIVDVAESTTHAAMASQNTSEKVEDGLRLVREMASSIEAVVAGVEEATTSIRELHTNSAEIGSLVDVIRGVAEQTNLLALNAAIEAARAGEHGRGFAVVADEVRDLSVRVQQSTQEIERVVGVMRDGVEKAVTVMEKDQAVVQGSLSRAEEATQALEAIAEASMTISGMTSQVAAATEEQSAVSEEIQSNIEGIRRISETTLQASCESLDSSRQLHDMTEAMANTVAQFR